MTTLTTTPERPIKPTTNTPKKPGLGLKTQLKASGPVLQHNEKLVRR
jgi:hypothetical protein